MKTSIQALIGAGLMGGILLLSAMPAAAVEPFNPAALPHDKASIQRLSDQQLDLLRKAVRFCGDFGKSRHNGNYCVISAVDKDVRDSGDESLKAFHWTLQPSARYNDQRSIVELQRLIDK